MEVSGQINDPAALLPEAGPPVSIAFGAGWTPVLSWKCRRKEIVLPLSGLELGFLGGSARSLVTVLSAVSRPSVKPCNNFNMFVLFKIVRGYSSQSPYTQNCPIPPVPRTACPNPRFSLNTIVTICYFGSI